MVNFKFLNLDFVRVHSGVGDEDLGVLQPLWLVHANLLVQQETWTDQRVTPRLGNQW